MQPKLLKNSQLSEFIPAEWNGVNESGYEAMNDYVMVLPDKAATKSSGGVELPGDVVDRHTMASETGVLIWVGPEAFKWISDRTRPWEGRKPQPGDRVFMNRYSGRLLTGDDGEEYRIMDDNNIGAVKAASKSVDNMRDESRALAGVERLERLRNRKPRNMAEAETKALCERLSRALQYELSERFMCVYGLPICYAQTGEEYAILEHSGPREEGQENTSELICHTPEQAAIALAFHIQHYVGERSGHLYWRCRPEITKSEKQGWCAYARLLISSEPVKWPTLSDYYASLAEPNKEAA